MRTIEERFWAKVDKRGPDECWMWTGCRDNGGYGRFSIGRARAGILATRVAVELSTGTEPSAHVCHRCDNPGCVNPAHLFLGTNRDNMRDCAAKGRTRRTPTVEKFDATDRALIRGLIAMGATKTAVADWMGSCQATVARIANGKTFTCDR